MKYREMFPNCFSGQGAISAYSQNANCPWYRAFGEDTPTLVETMFAVRSSEKVLTSVIAQFDSDNPAFRFVWLGVFSQFQQKWKRLFDDYATEYSPIDGYVVNETGTRKENNTGKDTTKYGKVVDVSGSDSGTIKDDTTSTDSNLNSGYGFNSVDGVPTDKSAGNSTDNTTTTRNLQSTGKNAQSGQDETDKSEDRNENYTIKKTGNIGYSMPQELLQADLDLWATTYFSRIFEDIENAIFITVYDCEPIRIISKQNGYILPVMTESVLGGGKAIPKTDDMNYKVGVDADGNLWYKQEQSKTKVVKFVRSTVDNSITSDTTNDEIFEYLNSGYIVSAVLTYVPGTDFYMTPGATVGNAITFDSYVVNGIYYSVTWNAPDSKWEFATYEVLDYTLPVMSSEVLGGGKAVTKTDDMTEEVGVDENGKLWYKTGTSTIQLMTSDIIGGAKADSSDYNSFNPVSINSDGFLTHKPIYSITFTNKAHYDTNKVTYTLSLTEEEQSMMSNVLRQIEFNGTVGLFMETDRLFFTQLKIIGPGGNDGLWRYVHDDYNVYQLQWTTDNPNTLTIAVGSISTLSESTSSSTLKQAFDFLYFWYRAFRYPYVVGVTINSKYNNCVLFSYNDGTTFGYIGEVNGHTVKLSKTSSTSDVTLTIT